MARAEQPDPDTEVVWIVWSDADQGVFGLDSVWATQDGAQQHADDLGVRRIISMVEWREVHRG